MRPDPRLDPRRVALGRVVAAFLRAGWRPPRPSTRIVRELADDIAAATPTGKPLAERQAEILALAAQGLSNRDIAAELGISVDSVKDDLKLVFRKLGARDRTHAVAIALSRGEIEFRADWSR